jgi:hypothetical protein
MQAATFCTDTYNQIDTETNGFHMAIAYQECLRSGTVAVKTYRDSGAGANDQPGVFVLARISSAPPIILYKPYYSSTPTSY